MATSIPEGKTFFQYFHETTIPLMHKKYNYSSIMAVPRIKKLVINLGIKQATTDKKHIKDALQEVQAITGQKPVVTKAKKSVASFKVREGMSIGVKVTLRGKTLYAFLYRLINICFPRIRDFRGLKADAFDEFGNYNFGVKEIIIFPEIDYDKIKLNKGMNLTLVFNTSKKEDAINLFREIGFPIKADEKIAKPKKVAKKRIAPLKKSPTIVTDKNVPTDMPVPSKKPETPIK